MGGEIAFKAYTPGQGELLPSHTADALDPSDPAFFVDEVVEGLDLRAFERRYSATGEHAHPPRMLLKLWLLGAISGVYSGREIARRLHYDLRFRYLAGDLRPDFRTVNRFRRAHVEDFREVLRQTVEIAREAGLGKLGRVAIDGTKIRANTSRHKAMSRGRMDEAEARLDDEIGQILMQIEDLNASEDDEHGDDDGGGGLPAELQSREARRERIRAARAQLEAEKGEHPEMVLADKGYLTEKSLEAMEKRKQRCLIAVGRERKKPKWPSRRRTRRMHRILRLPWARELYRHRKTQGERPFAVIKGPLNFRGFRLRSKRKARGEWDLAASAFNLLAIYREATA